jgi:hypothetical protein
MSEGSGGKNADLHGVTDPEITKAGIRQPEGGLELDSGGGKRRRGGGFDEEESAGMGFGDASAEGERDGNGIVRRVPIGKDTPDLDQQSGGRILANGEYEGLAGKVRNEGDEAERSASGYGGRETGEGGGAGSKAAIGGGRPGEGEQGEFRKNKELPGGALCKDQQEKGQEARHQARSNFSWWMSPSETTMTGRPRSSSSSSRC